MDQHISCVGTVAWDLKFNPSKKVPGVLQWFLQYEGAEERSLNLKTEALQVAAPTTCPASIKKATAQMKAPTNTFLLSGSQAL